MQYVVCYDIADDLRRARVARALLDFGTRVQESVFVAHLDTELAGRMRERLQGLADASLDRVHVFALCGECERKEWAFGAATLPQDEQWYVV